MDSIAMIGRSSVTAHVAYASVYITETCSDLVFSMEW